MCGSMVGLCKQSPTAEIRRGKERRRKTETTAAKYLLRRAARKR